MKSSELHFAQAKTFIPANMNLKKTSREVFTVLDAVENKENPVDALNEYRQFKTEEQNKSKRS